MAALLAPPLLGLFMASIRRVIDLASANNGVAMGGFGGCVLALVLSEGYPSDGVLRPLAVVASGGLG